MSEITTVELAQILPTQIWIEDDIFGGRTVMLQHEGCEAFPYARFNYDWRYTSNAGTWQAATDLALSLGAQEPIERTHRGFSTMRWWQRAMVWSWIRWDRMRRSFRRSSIGSSSGEGCHE